MLLLSAGREATQVTHLHLHLIVYERAQTCDELGGGSMTASTIEHSE
jgi:diadenosine tetraphosphate (Ap4A) HIT family hydrolase